MDDYTAETLIVQSYRTENVAGWMAICMVTVKDWAEKNGYAYEFVDDSLFDFVPPWFREKCKSHVLPQTDIARLHLIRKRIAQGWKRVVWIDADILVFRPDFFQLDLAADYSFCKEVWVHQIAEERYETTRCINNSVSVFTSTTGMLGTYVYMAEQKMAYIHAEAIGPTTIGTQLLTKLAEVMPIRVLECIGLFSPAVIRDIARGGGNALTSWKMAFGNVVGAANLCSSKVGAAASAEVVTRGEVEKAINSLLVSKGELVNGTA